VSNGLLPYRGIGSGVKRAIHLWSKIDFENDDDSFLFKAIIKREGLITTLKIVDNIGTKSSVKSSLKSTEKTGQKILELIKENPTISIAQMAEKLKLSTSAIEKQIAKLKKNKQLERIGPDKGGVWKIVKS
jgi:ATP-dependent DNA helicase RecG